MKNFNNDEKMLHDSHMHRAIGRYGIGKPNEGEKKFIQFSIDNSYTITNILYKHYICYVYNLSLN